MRLSRMARRRRVLAGFAAGLLGAYLPQVRALSLSDWIDPSVAPFIPVPEVAIDPINGTTLGLLPVWLQTDNQQVIRRIIAPDVFYNQYFGYGAHGRIFEFPSSDEDWSIVGGAKERLEREFDANYEVGRLRSRAWSFKAEAVFDRSGASRFYGIGNFTRPSDQTNYTEEQAFVQGTALRNLGSHWQISYTLRWRTLQITPGTLAGIPSIGTRFPSTYTEGSSDEALNRAAVVFDTRDDANMPTKGGQWVAYAGVASSQRAVNDSLYSEFGLDGREFWPIGSRLVVAAHTSLRYMPAASHTPFWALSSLGGDTSILGASQPLRGFGEQRFVDRNALCSNLELRQRLVSFTAGGTAVDLELTPFVDVGRVFYRADSLPLSHLHTVAGVGIRMVARPTVVGYVDVGHGGDGTVAFTGINYPF